MIKITDWVAVVPEEDKRIAYVGENDADTRQFLLTGADAATYADWSFHLDMAFDLSTVTAVSTHQSETTQESQQETISETATSLTATTTQESRDVTEVTVDCAYPTDVAMLTKKVTPEGLLLTWTILRQHTLLPGRLRATLRAVSAAGKVKKSAVMVFHVDAAVEAEPAATVPLSEFEVMEQRMNVLVDAATAAAETVEELAPHVRQNADSAALSQSGAAVSAQDAATAAAAAEAAAEKAETKVESLLERNKKLPVSLWVGTQAEYNAITKKDETRLYLISDDSTISDYANPVNLLDNSDFTNPVNQRGKTTITLSDRHQYFTDRWCVLDIYGFSTTLSVAATGVAADMSTVVEWQQRFAPNHFDTENKGYTLVIYYADRPAQVVSHGVIAHETGYDSVTFYVEFQNRVAHVALYEGIYTAENVPAYKPKGYAAELAECQRYYKRFEFGVLSGYLTTGGTEFITMLPGVPMVKTPTCQILGSGYYLRTTAGIYDSTGAKVPTGCTAANALNGQKLTFKWSEAVGTTNTPAALELREADGLDSEIVLSADY